MDPGSNIIKAVNLTAGYGAKATWRNANFSVGRGDFVGVLGSNGAGKTTLFRLLLGLLKPVEGQIAVFGSKPNRGNPHIGYVPQRHVVDEDLKLESLELVRLGLSGTKWGIAAHGAAADRAQALKTLAEVGAKYLAHRSLSTLSGGELQRVFLAQALVSKPEVLLLDEPLANLDIRRQLELVQLINKIVKSHGVTVLLIAHDINPLLNVLGSVIYMANGRVATGKPSQVITSQSLSRLYGAPVEVLRGSSGRLAVLGVEEAVHAHD